MSRVVLSQVFRHRSRVSIEIDNLPIPLLLRQPHQFRVPVRDARPCPTVLISQSRWRGREGEEEQLWEGSDSACTGRAGTQEGGEGIEELGHEVEVVDGRGACPGDGVGSL
jgi:hypothetical protein